MNLKYEDFLNKKESICVIGLGYVGLPLAVLLATKYKVVGYDRNVKRIAELGKFKDKTGEVSSEQLKNSKIKFTSDPSEIKNSKFIVIAVPTPVDEHNDPDLEPLKSATITVAKNISKGSIVVYESTVWPGLTEEVCVPLIERESGLKWKKDFFIGYSPERVNPGDKTHTIDKIKKVVSADTPFALNILSQIYGSVITAGIHICSSIRVAEASKVIENTQRDINIALINELSIIFNILGLNTKEVLEAASTKWNFLRFEPGLVGGHCIGVDPYYLTYKAREIGYHPQVILAGRKINDYMGKYVAEMTVKEIAKAGIMIKNSKVLIMGLSFKENIADIRNSKVKDIYDELLSWGVKVYVSDPYADKKDALKEYGIVLSDINIAKPYDAVILAVKHSEYVSKPVSFYLDMIRKNGVFVDVKSVYNPQDFKNSGIRYFSL